MATRRSDWTAALLCIVVGLVLLSAAAWMVRGPQVPDDWPRTSGRVVDWVASRDADGTTWASVIEYRDVGGSPHRLTSSTSSSFREGAGATHRIAYDRGDPARARVLDDVPWYMPVVFLGAGVLSLGLGLGLLVGPWLRARGRWPSFDLRRVVTDPSTGRTTFHRSRVAALAQLVAPWPFAAMMGTLGLLAGPPIGLLGLFFAVVLVLAGVAAWHRGLDTREVEVGPDGVWLPGLGSRAWTDFREIRVERQGRYESVALDGSTGPRRLGFVPRDPLLAEGRPGSERAAWAMASGFGRLVSALGAGPWDDPAPFGVEASALGAAGFTRLVEAVAAEVPVLGLDDPDVSPVAAAPTPGPLVIESQEPEARPWWSLIGPLASARPTGRAAAGTTVGGEWFGDLQAGLVAGIVMGMLALASLGSGAVTIWGGFLVVLGVVVARPVLRERRSRRRVAFAVGATLVGVVAGALAPSLLVAWYGRGR